MKNTYLTVKSRRESAEDLKNQILFGLIFGWVLFILGSVGYFSVSGGYEIIWVCIGFLGILLICLGVVFPSALKHPYKYVDFFGKKFGDIIFKIILAMIYIILILPIGLMSKKKRTQYSIYEWEDGFTGIENAFKKREYSGKNLDHVVAFPKLLNVYRLFGRIIENKWYVIIPATTVMIILGLILFFASTNVVSFFIYTIF